jgi:Flp pilus assembly protein TadD
MKDIDQLIDAEKYEEAFDFINQKLNENSQNTEFMFYKALLYQKTGEFANAINLYNKLLEIEPNNKEAQINIEMMQTIFRHSNKDIFACTNLHNDPWME